MRKIILTTLALASFAAPAMAYTTSTIGNSVGSYATGVVGAANGSAALFRSFGSAQAFAGLPLSASNEHFTAFATTFGPNSSAFGSGFSGGQAQEGFTNN